MSTAPTAARPVACSAAPGSADPAGPPAPRVAALVTESAAEQARQTLLGDLCRGYYDRLPDAERAALAFVRAVEQADWADDDERMLRLVTETDVWDAVVPGMLDEGSPLGRAAPLAVLP